MAIDFHGRRVVTAAELEEMTPAERQASFEESLVLDPDAIPASFQHRVLERVGSRIAERDQDQAAANQSPPPAEASVSHCHDRALHPVRASLLR